ncbi:GSCOCG00008277001-RA-CDS [Cotesia congregata]|uniref:Similar to CIP2A: Protein CIP2A (Homo sapiens) n=1 Tax=Cotesia congregata TaxID=51543 RepID=A0A8J2HDG1_COTCN|nr:GSCOCG00008277001-RA-CDS [Cotesia congregata]CAG5089686.1 Similar to CIP2A: Protein CIP2A (Homo sapiens) [Cotesia congregata]
MDDQNIRAFNAAVDEYLTRSNDTTSAIVRKCLDAITLSTDLGIFDKTTPVIADFYSRLTELMNSCDVSSPLTWIAMDVLQFICKNTLARQTLTHTYNFASIVSKAVNPDLVPEKRILVLRLLQELTHGINIQYSEPYLINLITTLSNWVILCIQEHEIAALSLAVLINVCRNLPAVYILMKKTDIKALYRRLITMESANIRIRVQCCKLLVVMEQINKKIPERVILGFVTTLMQNLPSAVADKDNDTIKLLVELFEEMQANEHFRPGLLAYPNYTRDVESITKLLNSLAPESTVLIIKFFHSLVKLRITKLISQYPELLKFANTWITDEQTAIEALGLVRAIISDSIINKKELIEMINFDILTPNLENSENTTKLTELMKLFLEIIGLPCFHKQVCEILCEKKMRELLEPLNSTITSQEPQQMAVYVHALALTAKLAKQSLNWLALFIDVAEKHAVRMIVALGIFTGDAEVKQTALEVFSSTNCSKEFVSGVVKCMCELNPMAQINSASRDADLKLERLLVESGTESFSLARQQELEQILEKLGDLVKEDRISDIFMKDVIELYEHQKLVQQQVDRINMASIESARRRVAILEGLIEQAKENDKKLRQLLYYSQQNEAMWRTDAAEMSQKVSQTEETSKKLVSSLRKEKAQLEEKMLSFDKVKASYATLETERDRLVGEKHKLEEKVQGMKKKIIEVGEAKAEVEDRLGKREQELEKANKELETLQVTLANHKRELKESSEQAKKLSRTITEKEDEIKKLNTEIKELVHLRTMIYNLTAAKNSSVT